MFFNSCFSDHIAPATNVGFIISRTCNENSYQLHLQVHRLSLQIVCLLTIYMASNMSKVFDFLFSFGMHSWSIFSSVAFDRPVKNSIVECICLDLNALS